MKFNPRKIKRLGLIGALTFLGGYGIYVATDRYVSQFIEKSRPQLQDQLAKKLGHPLVIGPYKGLRAWGLSLGPSKVLKGYEDPSTVSVSSLKVQFAPIASFLNWRPVLIFSPKQARLHLDPNVNGQYWVLGTGENSGSNNLDLRIRLDNSSEVFLDSSKEAIRAKANASFVIPQKRIRGAISFVFPDNGSLHLEGNGYWDRLSFLGKIKFSDFNLDNLQSSTFSRFNYIADGRVNANIQLGVQKSKFICKGRLDLDNFYLSSLDSSKSTLLSKETAINCRNRSLEILPTQFKYGLWNVNLKGKMPIRSRSFSKLNLLSSVWINNNSDSALNIDTSLPLLFDEQGLSFGDLLAQLNLNAFPLSSLDPIFGTSMSGTLNAAGSLKGSFSSLTSNISVELNNPQIAGLVRLQEKWTGDFIGFSDGGGELTMSSDAGAVPGKLKASLNNNWSLNRLLINRLGGSVAVEQVDSGYSWKANDFRLDRIEVALPPKRSFERVFGKLIGQGTLLTDPFLVEGQISYRFPRIFGVNLREAKLNGTYSNNNYSLTGVITPPDKGKILVTAEGVVGGPIKANALAKGISPSWLADSSLKISEFNVAPKVAIGTAKTLEGLSLVSLKDSLDNQLGNWDLSRVFVETYKRQNTTRKIINPAELAGSLDAEADFEGSNVSDLKVEVKASGRIWIKGDDIDAIEIKPFSASFKSFSFKESGEFSVLNLPISVLSLFFSSPPSITGMFGVTGKYNYKKKLPGLSAELVLSDARLAEKEILLRRGKIFISRSLLELDISLKEATAKETIDIYGQLPLTLGTPMDIKVESHGDGLSFLDGLADDLITWKSGDSDLRLFIRGNLNKPIANGYLVVSKGTFLFKEKLVENFESKIVFDFDRLFVEQLTANVGEDGIINSYGGLPLFASDSIEDESLKINLQRIYFRQRASTFKVTSDLDVKGGVIKPLIGGVMTIEEGVISTKRSGSSEKKSNQNDRSLSKKNLDSSEVFPEQGWDYKDPLILFIQNKKSPASKILETGLPKGLSSITFDAFKLNLGPDLKLSSPPIANFVVNGSLMLNGPLSDDLELTGVLRLEKGRVNLFTTTFDLDKSQPNIALFAPSMGLIPYLDVALITRVPDVIQDPSLLSESNDFVLNSSGVAGIGGSRFVKVKLTASGPADRVSESFQLRSTPPLPSSQLLDLIGGNSLSMLMSGSEKQVLVDMLNRSFLSPVLGDLTSGFNDKIQVSLYPAFVSANYSSNEESDGSDQDQSDSSEVDSTNLYSKQAWVAELGLDLSEKINLSVQATPNRKDIPPQGIVTYQLNSNIGILGALDKEFNWQGELQLFIRY